MKFQAPVGMTHLSCAGTEIDIGSDGGFDAPEAQREALRAHGCRDFVPAIVWSEAFKKADAISPSKGRRARPRPSLGSIEKGL